MNEKPSKDKTIAIHYAELNKYGQTGEYERALKAANKILGVAPHEFLAFNCKIVCLLQLSRFEEALIQINKKLEYLQQLIFEKAYCLYRLNRMKDALQTIDLSEDNIDYRTKELKAQILYRLERYSEAYTTYQDTIRNTDDEYEEERLTNLYATMVYLISDIKEDIEELKEPTYESCYNKACMLITLNNYVEAEKKLKQCEKLYLEKIEEDDDVTEEEANIELALIRIQMGYVLQKQGRTKEAELLYTSNLKLKLEDISLQAVASNNIVCINKDKNLFDSKKKMKVATNESLIFKLPSAQRKYISLNNAILSYYTDKRDECENMCKNIEANWPDLVTVVGVLRAFNLVKAEKVPEAMALLQKMAKINTDKNLYSNLCIAQLHLINEDKLQACKVLENMGEDTYRPGVIGALTTLYLGVGDEAAALKVFERAVAFYKKNKVKSGDLSNLWKQAADFHIRNGHPQVAANSLEELLSASKGDQKITAQLVLAYSQFDKNKSLQLSKQLPSTKEISTGIDLEKIQILATVTMKKSPGIKSDSQPGTPKSEESKKKNKHKKKKGKLPKNFSAGSVPDPERWLPKYDRTGYRKKKDRRTKEIIKGSQGTSSGQSDQYDFSSKKASSSPSAASPSPRGAPPTKQSHQKKANQKKKNRRR